MKKLVTLFFLSLFIATFAQAGVVQGKKLYAAHLHEACGFTGDVMGKKYTAAEWKQFYQDGTFAQVIKEECPRSKILTNKQDLRSLVSFLVMFAKDTGNKPACGN